ncbi:pickpocket protein 28-like [Chironomus tepperi]|uniref:pickpocket protein 28-like n=1 Tax=Chironomus tepperi TaxID=113505 RepID=UPI00391F31F2
MEKSVSKQCLNTYASSATIHGVRYIIGSDESQKSFRIFWIIAFIFSIFGLGYYAYGVYMKWSIEPDIGLTVRMRPMREIPFPAITICSPLFARDNMANFSRFYAEYTSTNGKILPYLTPEEQNYLSANIQACTPTSASMIEKSCSKRTEKNISKLLRESSLKVPELFAACRFKKNYIKCEKMLNRVLTNNGYCYTLNMQSYQTIFNENVISGDFDSFKREKIAKSFDKENQLYNESFNDADGNLTDANQWSLDTGYTTNDDNVFPIRAIKINQLTVYMKLTESDSTNLCLSQGKGYKIIFHLPNEIPTPFHDEYFISFDYERMMTLTAKSFRNDPEMKKYAPESRRCYFDGERNLKYFKSYTKAHCDYECMTNYTLKQCGCVKFSMPRSDDTPVCDLDKTKCYFKAMMEWPDKDDESQQGDGKMLMPCNCLPSCSDIKYSIKLDKEAILDSAIRLAHLKNKTESNVYARMAIRFNDHSIDEQENYVAYKLQNFIADFGGLLGLFMGCSILSIVEVIFHCIRACFKRGQIEEIEIQPVELVDGNKNGSQLSNQTFILNSTNGNYYKNNEGLDSLKC